MSFYIYENWQAGPHKAVIHHGSCAHCNNGIGRDGSYDPNNAKWHGPFQSLSKAREAQLSMNVFERMECRWCVASF